MPETPLGPSAELPLGLTPSQTVGPFLSLVLPWPDGPEVVPAGTAGGFWIRGRLLDGDGEPVPDGVVETWQAAPDGRFDAPGFRGFGRSATDPDGRWEVHTVKPGVVDTFDGRPQAPHLAVTVLARGLLDRVVTRIYFADEAPANAADPVLQAVPADRRATLVAASAAGGYAFDIHLQGDAETVFFDV
jgi:protocatechuate 3,4-dioxygenase alpha subunit